MSERHEREQQRNRRMAKFIDRDMALKDPFYNVQIAMMRNWLTATEVAMEDEGVPEGTIERVLNRLIIGTPSGADAYQRVERFEVDVQQVMKGL